MVYGGGAAEIACSLAVAVHADQLASLEQYAFRAFAEALESIPLALAENSGLSAIHALGEIKVCIKLDCLNKTANNLSGRCNNYKKMSKITLKQENVFFIYN